MRLNTIRTDQIEIRPAKLHELEEICRLVDADHMNDGVHNLKIAYSTPGSIMTVAVDDNKIIGVYVARILHIPEGTITFGFMGGLHPDYRGLRISGLVTKSSAQYPSHGYLLPAAIKAQRKLRKFGHKLLTYSGNPTIEKLDNFRHSASTEFEIIVVKDFADLDGIVAYDRTVFDYERSDFMRAWCKPSNIDEPFVRTLVAKQGSDVVGFGTLRLFSKSYYVQPLYANNDAIASAILMELVRLYTGECDDRKPFTVMFFATNHAIMEFVRKAGLQFDFCFVQGYIDGTESSCKIAEAIEKYIRMDRVYLTQYYWTV